jgi:DNA-binding CsgD family transcriptional regulator
MDWEDSVAHPLVRHYAIRRDTMACTLVEVPDGRRWRTAGRFAPARAKMVDWPHQLALPLGPRADHVRILGLARGGRNFTTHELGYVRRVHRFLTAFDLHLQVISPVQTTCAGATVFDRDPSLAAAADARVTPRELAVLALLADGHTITSVGRRLQISPRTVAKHQENLQRKLDARDRLTMLLAAQRLGLVRPQTPRAR